MSAKNSINGNQLPFVGTRMSAYKDLLILPSQLVDELDARSTLDTADAAPAAQAVVASASEAEAIDTWPNGINESPVEPTLEPKLDPNWLFEAAELEALVAGQRGRLANSVNASERFPTMTVYREEAVDHALKTLGAKFTDNDEKKTNASRLELMKEAGGVRRIAQFDPEVSLNALDVLDHDFPNFAEVTAYLRGEFALGRADDCTVQPSPVLLDGPPGCGKTEYARRVSSLFGLQPEHFHVINVATLQTSASLCGSSSHYANTKSGLIFDELVLTRYANPVILLDEIDKARGDDRFSPAAVLYGLLSDSARHFTDEAVPAVPIDARHIIWFLTSNYADLIEPALLSRLMRFDIDMPTPDQSRIIVANIYKSMQTLIKGLRSLTLTEGAIGRLIVLSPRNIRETLKLAAGQALLDGRRMIQAKDVPILKTKASIGF